MDDDDADKYYCGCGIKVTPIKPISDAETEEASVSHSGHEERDGVHSDFPGPRLKNYEILKLEDIRQRQKGHIESIMNVLHVSRTESCALLCYYSWDLNRIHEEWFSDEERTRKSVGILKELPITCPKSDFLGEFLCSICCESRCVDQQRHASCGHPMCNQCWKTYISKSIKDIGHGCLEMRCPVEVSCPAVVGFDMVRSLASASDFAKYQSFFLRSYVEKSRMRKWCPAPACENAAEYEAGVVSESCDVSCDCGHKFCWNCIEETHRPLSCEMVARWHEKHNDGTENTDWIRAYTKPCPNCNQRIEKDQGCNHMRCPPPCCFEFCWSCLGDWSDHTGSDYECNRFTEAMLEDDQSRLRAEKSLKRYAHHYGRWVSNDESRKLALADQKKAGYDYMNRLSQVQGEPYARMVFVTEAWEQIVECRRVLKWSYAYGYLCLEEGSTKTKFFEDLQGLAEENLEWLHHCAEKKLKTYIESPSPDFINFRDMMVHTTRVTRIYFEKFVTALEDNFEEILKAAEAELV